MTQHTRGCCHSSSSSSTKQSLDEVEFERGIWAAARDGDRDRVVELLRKGVEASKPDTSGYTALHYAARAGHTHIVKELLRGGADVNATTGGGATPLHRAAYQGHKDVVATLLDAGANPDLQVCNNYP